MDREQLSKIGFNNSVSLDIDPRKVMVQTEVVARDEVLIRTRVLHAGVLQASEKHASPDASSVEQVREAARIQHERILEKVRQGG